MSNNKEKYYKLSNFKVRKDKNIKDNFKHYKDHYKKYKNKNNFIKKNQKPRILKYLNISKYK